VTTSAPENISYYNRGMMGYQTPNIDRIAHEGVFFTDYYGQQSPAPPAAPPLSTAQCPSARA
jgi:arylsulfatase A-like enzyme